MCSVLEPLTHVQCFGPSLTHVQCLGTPHPCAVPWSLSPHPCAVPSSLSLTHVLCLSHPPLTHVQSLGPSPHPCQTPWSPLCPCWGPSLTPFTQAKPLPPSPSKTPWRRHPCAVPWLRPSLPPPVKRPGVLTLVKHFMLRPMSSPSLRCDATISSATSWNSGEPSVSSPTCSDSIEKCSCSADISFCSSTTVSRTSCREKRRRRQLIPYSPRCKWHSVRVTWHFRLEISFTHFEIFEMMFNVSDMNTFQIMASLS